MRFHPPLLEEGPLSPSSKCNATLFRAKRGGHTLKIRQVYDLPGCALLR